MTVTLLSLSSQENEYSAIPVRESGFKVGVTLAVEEKERGIALPAKENIPKKVNPQIKKIFRLIPLSPPSDPFSSSNLKTLGAFATANAGGPIQRKAI